jgi:glycosyltransferase involved in cell wall biosynthesis
MTTGSAPRSSVIVPTRNRLRSLRRTLESLYRQDFDPDRWELIVADDAGSDGTEEYLSKEAAAGRLMALRQSHAGASAARNRGIRAARGEIVAFTDDDCEVPPDWLTAFDRIFSSRSLDAVGGSAENAVGSTLSQVHQDIASWHSGKENADPSRPRFLTTNNFACRRGVLEAAGLFDSRFVVGGEDRELVARLLRLGFQVGFAPEIVVKHHHEFTVRSFAGHYFRMGRGSYLLHRVIPGETGATVRRLKARDYTKFAGQLLSESPRSRALPRAAFFALGQAAAASGFLATWVSHGFGRRPLRSPVEV